MNTRLAVATHILTYIENRGGTPVPSEEIAVSVSTNPALIRRLLSQLTKAGLTTAQMGSGGGSMLARPARKITLLDVLGAVDEKRSIFALHDRPNPKCPIGRNINVVLKKRISAAEQAMEAQLARTTIADMVSDITGLNQKAG